MLGLVRSSGPSWYLFEYPGGGSEVVSLGHSPLHCFGIAEQLKQRGGTITDVEVFHGICGCIVFYGTTFLHLRVPYGTPFGDLLRHGHRVRLASVALSLMTSVVDAPSVVDVLDEQYL